MKTNQSPTKRAGIGATPSLCHDALIQMLKELFEGKTFHGQEGQKPLNIFKQDLPVPRDVDDDTDTDKACAPYIVVRATDGEIAGEGQWQTVGFDLLICCYDTGGDREGYTDVSNIKEDIIQRVCERPYFGGAFTVLKPITWALQQDDTHPYYFGALVLKVSAPAMTQDRALEEFV